MSGGRVSLTPELFKPAPGVKPTYPVEIDWEHPLAKGLVACFMPVGDRTIDVARLAQALVPTSSSNTHPEATNLGMGVTVDSSYTDGLEGSFQIESLTEYSYGINGKLITLTSAKRKFVAGQYQHTGSGYDLGGPYINGDYSLDFYPKNGSNVGSTTKTYSDGERLQWLGSYKSGETNGAQHFIPGEAVSATVSGSAGTAYNFAIGGKWQNLLQVSSTILIVPVWNRALTQAEAERWFADPYQILKPAVPQTQIITPASTPNDRVWIV